MVNILKQVKNQGYNKVCLIEFINQVRKDTKHDTQIMYSKYNL